MEIDRLLLEMILPKEDEKLVITDCLKSFKEGHFAFPCEKEIDNRFLVHSEGHLYFRKTFDQETFLLNELIRLFKSKPPFIDAEVVGPLLEPQKKAIQNCINRSLSILIGGPGTGKTFTAGYVIKTLLDRCPSLTFVLCAPTGKACSQLKQSIQSCCQNLPPHRVLTLHALLDLEKEIRTPLIPEDLVIVDEASMIDIDLFGELFSRIKEGGRLLLIGDPNQLPPVETAPIFPEIVDLFDQMNCLNNLQTCMRVENHQLIQSALDLLRGQKNFAMRPLSEFSLEAFNDEVRILTPLKVGPHGVDALNASFLERVLTKSSMLTIPIMITKNDFNLRLFNGEVGCIQVARKNYRGNFRSSKEAIALFETDGEARRFPVYQLPPFDLGFALSVHKSQGSAFDHPILLLPKGTSHFGRELLYTAFTRSKKGITIYGDEQEVTLMLEKSSRRRSALTKRFLAHQLKSHLD